MSNPRPESRIKSLEQRVTDMEADIIELSSDQAEELKAIRKDIKQLNDGMMSSFKKIGDTFIEIVANKEDLTAMENRIIGEITELRTTTATKDDLARLESDMAELKGMMKQLLQQKPSE